MLPRIAPTRSMRSSPIGESRRLRLMRDQHLPGGERCQQVDSHAYAEPEAVRVVRARCRGPQEAGDQAHVAELDDGALLEAELHPDAVDWRCLVAAEVAF